MKRILALFTCAILMASMVIPVSAVEQSRIIYSETSVLENGIVVTDEIIEVPQGRSTDVAYTRNKSFTYDGTLIATIAFTATYRYNGSTVYVVSKAVTQTDTYDGWSYSQQSFTSSSGTVTLSGKLSKLLILNSSFSMSMTCDKDGNISYS